MLQYKSADDLFQLHVYKKGGVRTPWTPPPPPPPLDLPLVEEPKIEALTPCFFSMYTWSSIRATSGETTRIALLPPSLCSIRNGRVWLHRLCSCHSLWAGRRTHHVFHTLLLLLQVALPLGTHQRAPNRDREKEPASRKVSSTNNCN